jgi:hypothetical protein
MREGPLHLAHIFQSKVSRSADKLPDAHLRQCIQNLEQVSRRVSGLWLCLCLQRGVGTTPPPRAMTDGSCLLK